MARREGSANRRAGWLNAATSSAALLLSVAAMSAAASAPAPATPGEAAAVPASAVAAGKQRVFASADQAVEALIAANRGDRLGELAQILGPGGARLIHSGDAVADRNHRARFVAAYDTAHRIELQGANRGVLIVGTQDWPLPIPLIRGRSGWRFDTLAGEREILDRRIGRNELTVIKVCRAFVEAQREYAAQGGSAAAKGEYAQHFMSHEGQHDGLYWPSGVGEPQSPLGPLVAQARAQGYASEPSKVKPQPYHGYYFRMLTRQGAHAPGGAKSYLIDGHMTGGFALLAYPALYGNSGIMSFIVDQDGIVFERNFGSHTAEAVSHIEEYDPDSSWRVPP